MSKEKSEKEPQEVRITEAPEISDEDLRALFADLIELEKSGTLDVAVTAIKKMDELLQYLFQEPALYRLLAVLLDGSLGAARQLSAEDVINLKATISEVGGCVAKNAGVDKLKSAKPLGLGGLMKAMGDPDVQKGIGITIELLRAIGKCTSAQSK
ncbi:DUF1641 domain-containing protein [Tardisphaera saccharovorans]|nr:DUF1641 domain-containing protein [TACK group archaeon]